MIAIRKPLLPTKKLVAIIFLAVGAATVVGAQISKLPAAISAAFMKSYPNAMIKSASSEKENGKTVWEVESVDGATNRDIVYALDGTAEVIEEQITAADVPAVVAAALKARYPKAIVTKYEKLTRGTKTSFEMILKGGPAEIELAPDGTFINPKPVAKKAR